MTEKEKAEMLAYKITKLRFKKKEKDMERASIGYPDTEACETARNLLRGTSFLRDKEEKSIFFESIYKAIQWGKKIDKENEVVSGKYNLSDKYNK
jgi:hypothetical protein